MKLLLVEDDVKIADAVTRGLQAEGFTVERSTDGDDAVWRVSEGGYDLVLLDIMLPGRNGYQVCRALREAGNWIPILMLTAKDGELDEAEGLDTGADDYLTKPFSFAVLVSRIHALLRRSAPAGPGPLVVGDLTVDVRTRSVTRAGVGVDLTAREFDVLEFLARRVGTVVTKRDILAGVWDLDYTGDPNIVEVYVARLRRKIDDPFARSSIETLRGAGYRLVPS